MKWSEGLEIMVTLLANIVFAGVTAEDPLWCDETAPPASVALAPFGT